MFNIYRYPLFLWSLRPSNSGHFLGPRLVIMSDAPPAEPTVVQQVSGPEAGKAGKERKWIKPPEVYLEVQDT